MSIENPNGSKTLEEVLAALPREDAVEGREHANAEQICLDLFIRLEVENSTLNDEQREQVVRYMHEHAGSWRLFNDGDIYLYSVPEIRDGHWVLVFNVSGQAVDECIPLV